MEPALDIAYSRRARSRRRQSGAGRRWGSALLASLALAACGDDSTSGQTNAARSEPTIVLIATLTITGAVPLTGVFNDTISTAASSPTCADAVAGYIQDRDLRYDLPHVAAGDRVGGHAVAIDVRIGGYHGPAVYAVASLISASGPATVTIDATTYVSAAPATATVTVAKDGSGTMKFDKFGAIAGTPPAALVPKGPAVAGTLSWTCVARPATTR